MSDLISRQAAIDALHMHLMYRMGTDSNKKRLDDWINGVPSAQPEQRWILCSERLPEENGFYLATLDGEICGENEPFAGLAEYENGKWVDDEEDYQCVLAWMPLPEPYREERTEE